MALVAKVEEELAEVRAELAGRPATGAGDRGRPAYGFGG